MSLLCAMQDVVWERSYYTLRCIFGEAVKKLSGPVSTIYTTTLDDGQMQASVTLPRHPFVFLGNPAPTKAAAKAKLCYAVIKYVNTEMGIPIMDINYPVKQHQDRFMSRFDRKMKGIWECGEKLCAMVNEIEDLFVRATDELAPRLSQGPIVADVVAATQAFSVRIAHLKAEFIAGRDRLAEFKVTLLFVNFLDYGRYFIACMVFDIEASIFIHFVS